MKPTESVLVATMLVLWFWWGIQIGELFRLNSIPNYGGWHYSNFDEIKRYDVMSSTTCADQFNNKRIILYWATRMPLDY